MTALFLAAMLLKGALVLALAGIATTWLRRSSAAIRHGVWTLAFLGLLAIPMLSGALPTWGHPLLPAAPDPFALAQSPVGESTEPVVVDPNAATPRPTAASDPTRAGRPTGATRADSRSAGLDWGGGFVLVWLVGVALILGRLGAEIWRVQGVSRRALPLRRDLPPGWAALGWREVDADRVRVSHEVPSPMTWGTLRPTILLPGDAESWDSRRLRLALAHEGAHVARHDYLVHMLGRVALALHWMNPLVWVCARRMSMEREKACDDRVLSEGADPALYASELVSICRALLHRRRLRGSGVFMARPSQIEGRVLSILDERAVRTRPGARGTVLVAGLSAIVTVGVAVRPVWGAPSTDEPGEVARPSTDEAVLSETPTQGLEDDFGELVYELAIDAPEGGQALVDVPDVDVVLRPGAARERGVRVFVDGPDIELARELYARQAFRIGQTDDGLSVVARRPRYTSGDDWRRHRDVRVTAVVTLPERFDASVSTEDGRISAHGLRGDVTLTTVDGWIDVGTLHGPSATLRTSDGVIRASALMSRVARVLTSDSDIRLGVAGDSALVQAHGGDIDVRLLGTTRLDAYSHAGDVSLRLPDGVGADLDVSGRRVDWAVGSLEGERTQARAAGAINGGGLPVRARAPSGVVSVSESEPGSSP